MTVPVGLPLTLGGLRHRREGVVPAALALALALAVDAQAALGLFADSIGWAQRAGWPPEAATGYTMRLNLTLALT